MAGAPIPQHIRLQVAAMYRDGKTQAEIQRATGVSHGSVQRIIKAAGLPPNERSSWTRAANEARLDKLAERRTNIIDRLYALASDKLADLEQAKDAGWRTVLRGELGVEETRTLQFVPARDFRDVATSLSTLVDRAARLEAVDSPATRAAVSLLTSLADQIGVDDKPPADQVETPAEQA